MTLVMKRLQGENAIVMDASTASRRLRWRVVLPCLLIGTPLAQTLGLLIGWKWLLPVLAILPFYPLLVLLLREGRRRDAVLAGLLWALLLGIGGTTLSVFWPDQAGESIWNGVSYQAEMQVWLETGVGAESDPSRFIPQHLLHLTAFTLLCVGSGGLLGMLLGAALMHYMSFYVAFIITRSGDLPWLPAALCGWHPWSVIRVIAFVILGIALAEPLVARLSGQRISWRPLMPWILVGGTGILLDILLKWSLADGWRHVLLSVSGPVLPGS